MKNDTRMDLSLERLGIRQLEERLEMCALAAGGGVQGAAFWDPGWQYCCHHQKCNDGMIPQVGEDLPSQGWDPR